jgi:superfamily II DNA or RNA helicase
MIETKLRPYQETCLSQIKGRYLAGISRQLVSMATGTGKSIVFASLPSYLGLSGKILILSHRKELIEQTIQHMRRHLPQDTVGLEMANQQSDPSSRVVVASVQTIGRSGSRVRKFNANEFDAIIVDEAHHSIASSYKRVITHFGVSKFREKQAVSQGGGARKSKRELSERETSRLLIGFTATPNRGDGIGLGKVYDEIVYSYSILDGIRDGWLVDLRGYRVTTREGLDQVSVRAGDFAPNELARAVNVKERNELIVQSWLKLGEDRQSIVFCVDVSHAKSLAQVFTAKGIPCESIWASDPERRKKLQAHQDGKIKVLTNVGILTEGYDDWRVACVVMARPTQSELLYTQMIGRGTRIQSELGNLHEVNRPNLDIEKRDAIVIDIVDNTRKHRLITLPTLLGLPPELDLKGHSATKTSNRIKQQQAQHPAIRFDGIESVDEIDLLIEKVELLGEHQSGANEKLRIGWFECPGHTHLLHLRKEAGALVQKDVLGGYKVFGYVEGVVPLMQDDVQTVSEAREIGEKWVLALAGTWVNLSSLGVDSEHYKFAISDKTTISIFRSSQSKRYSVIGSFSKRLVWLTWRKRLPDAFRYASNQIILWADDWMESSQPISSGQKHHLILLFEGKLQKNIDQLSWTEAASLISSEWTKRKHLASYPRDCYEFNDLLKHIKTYQTDKDPATG